MPCTDPNVRAGAIFRSHDGVCPNCGYCPHCGRGGYGFSPWRWQWPGYRYGDPIWMVMPDGMPGTPIWQTGGTTSGGCTFAYNASMEGEN